MDSYIKDIRLTPEIDKMQVDNELDDLHSSQVLLPLKNTESVCVIIYPGRDNCEVRHSPISSHHPQSRNSSSL
jgi:hypothetical protein